MQKFNRLFIVVEESLKEKGYEVFYKRMVSFINHMISGKSPVGKFDLIYAINKKSKHQILVNSLFIGNGYGADHKADEWGARRRLLEYRYGEEGIYIEKLIFTFYL